MPIGHLHHEKIDIEIRTKIVSGCMI